jgi:thiamine biosynthesis lipoprotein
VQLDPNGIAQGYTVDVIADFFERNLIKDYVIEVGGEIRVKGRKPGNKKISVGIEMPAGFFNDQPRHLSCEWSYYYFWQLSQVL